MGFWLIQRGTFNDLKGEYDNIAGSRSNALIDLDYMGYAEFEWDAIPCACRRIMQNKEQYIFHYCNDIKDSNGKIMVVYCKRQHAEAIEAELKKYISSIKTDSSLPNEPKSTDCTLFEYIKLFGSIKNFKIQFILRTDQRSSAGNDFFRVGEPFFRRHYFAFFGQSVSSAGGVEAERKFPSLRKYPVSRKFHIFIRGAGEKSFGIGVDGRKHRRTQQQTSDQ